MSPEQIIEEIKRMPPGQALAALEVILKDDPKLLKVIQDAKQLPEDKQQEVVNIIASGLEAPK